MPSTLGVISWHLRHLLLISSSPGLALPQDYGLWAKFTDVMAVLRRPFGLYCLTLSTNKYHMSLARWKVTTCFTIGLDTHCCRRRVVGLSLSFSLRLPNPHAHPTRRRMSRLPPHLHSCELSKREIGSQAGQHSKPRASHLFDRRPPASQPADSIWKRAEHWFLV